MPDPIVTNVFYEYRAPAHMKGETLSILGEQFPVEGGKLRIPAHLKRAFETSGFFVEFEPIKAAFERADEEMERIRVVHREAIERAAAEQYAPDFETVRLTTPPKATAEKAEREPASEESEIPEPQTPLVEEKD